jgi:hypothetical protein
MSRLERLKGRQAHEHRLSKFVSTPASRGERRRYARQRRGSVSGGAGAGRRGRGTRREHATRPPGDSGADRASGVSAALVPTCARHVHARARAQAMLARADGLGERTARVRRGSALGKGVERQANRRSGACARAARRALTAVGTRAHALVPAGAGRHSCREAHDG